MADLNGLKKRVEQIDLRLKSAHNAREKESAALMQTWEQIRERFIDQNVEITQLRDRIAQLEDTRDDLLQMVHGLLTAVEGDLEKVSDETIPNIKAMAGSLLNGEGDLSPAAAIPADILDEADVKPGHLDVARASPTGEAKETNFHDDLLSAIERSIEFVGDSNVQDEEMPIQTGKARKVDHVDEPASLGIRDLVARIETAVGPDLLDASAEAQNMDENEDELSRDLREIEALRGELHGLRQRISNGS